MSDTTETNEAASARAEGGASASDNPRPVTFPRDRRKYTRFLDPLYTGPGLQLFEGPEHEAFGDGLWFVDGDGNQFQQSAPNTNYFLSQGGQSFSFGQILALAGDFYGIPSQPISDAPDAAAQQQAFLNAFNTLWTEPLVILFNANVSPAQKILALMQQQSADATAAQAAILANDPTATDSWSQAYSQINDDDQYDIAYNNATGGNPDIHPWWWSQGRYLKLAATNWDHFGANALAAYKAGHTAALQAAGQGNWSQAYAMEAFACHFLTDLFSAGHLRTPRKSLHTGNSFSDLCSRLMHDEDCYNGLVVQNTNGDTWTAYGDKRLNDPANSQSFSIARNAVQASLQDVCNAVTSGDGSPVFSALGFIPNLDSASDRNSPYNWSPLFVVDSGTVKFREAWNDLTCRLWTSNFYYASVYAAVPNGGVHSLAGAPPRQGAGPAHALKWQNNRIIGSSEDDLAPAAAVVTLNTTIGNTQPTGELSPSQQETALDAALQNILCVVFRKTSSDNSNHHLHFLAIPMTDAPAFKIYTPTEIAVGGQSHLSSDGGDPAVVARPGALLMIYPDSNGVLLQATWSANQNTWSSPGTGSQQAALSSTDSANYKLLAPASGSSAGPRAALCNVNGQGLFMVFPSRVSQNGGNLVFCSWNPAKNLFNTPIPVFFTGMSGSLTAAKSSMSVGMTEYGGALVMAFVNANGNNSICVLQIDGGEAWSMLSPVAEDPFGQIITTHSVVSLATYGGMLLLLVNDDNGNIITYAWRPQSQCWTYYQIQGTTNGGKTITALQTRYPLSPVTYEGAPYIVFTDKANGAPSIMTTATNVISGPVMT